MIGIIDTNILIYFSKGDPKASWLLQHLESGPCQYGISAITETELFSKFHLVEEERLVIDECIQQFSVIPVDSTIARWAALYRSHYRLALADALIAATARSLDVPFLTYNTKDFQKITGLVVQQPKHA